MTGNIKKILLLLLFPVICFGQISEWYYDVSSGDAFSEDKPYILVISSEKIDGIYRPTLMLSKRGGNDYYSLMIIDIGYLSDNDDDLKIEIAFDDLKKTVREIDARVNRFSGKSILVIDTDINNLLIDFRDFNKVSFKITSYYPSMDVIQFDVTLSGFTKALNKIDANYWEKLRGAEIEKQREIAVKDSLYSIAIKDEKLKKEKLDFFESHVKDSIVPEISKLLDSQKLELISEQIFDIKNDIIDRIEFSIENGREINTNTFSNVKIITNSISNKLNIKLSSDEGRVYWFSDGIPYRKDYTSRNNETANTFFIKFSGDYKIKLIEQYGIKSDSKKTGILKIHKTKTLLKHKNYIGVKTILTPSIPKFKLLKQNEMYFKSKGSRRIVKITFDEKEFKYEWGYGSTERLFENGNGALFQVQ